MSMENKSSQTATLLKVLSYIKKYKLYIILSLVTAAVTVASSLYIPILTGDAIDYIIGPGKVDYSAILKIIIEACVVMGITAISQWIMNTCNNRITFHVVRDIRDEAFKKIEILPLKYIDANSYGDIVSRVIADTDQFADGLLMGFTQLFTGVLTIVGTLGFMLSINAGITLIVVLITPLSLFVASFIAKHTFSMFKLQSQTRGEQTALIDEMIGNQKVVQAFGYQDDSLARFDVINDKLQHYSLRAIFFSSITNPATRFVNSLVYAGVGIFGAFFAINGRLTVGQLSCFLSYANQYTKPFNEISGVITEIQNAIACAARIIELIEEEPQIPDSDNAITMPAVKGNIDIEHVYFSYVPGRPLFEDFNLKVKPGQRVAIVGPTGCGTPPVLTQPTLLYAANSVSINSSVTDIRDITRGSLRTNYGMVLQETWLRSGTIRDNICMGKPDATEEEIIRAAKYSHAHGSIKRLPKVYDTVITDDGVSLSQ